VLLVVLFCSRLCCVIGCFILFKAMLCYWLLQFVQAMLCYWLSANVFSFIQVMFLKLAPVKKYFNIPELVKHDESILSAQKKPFLKSIKDSKCLPFYQRIKPVLIY